MTSVLVLCIGNEFRGDDGVAHEAGRIIAQRAVPGVVVRHERQLLPEHAELVAEHDTCIILDASTESLDEPVITRVEPGSNGPALHGFGAADILRYVRNVYGIATAVHVCAIPAREFPHGETLSHSARRMAESAARAVLEHLRDSRD